MEISILALPLIASIISGFFGKFIGDRNSEIVYKFIGIYFCNSFSNYIL